MATRSGRRIRESYSENDVVAHNVIKDKGRIDRTKRKENATETSDFDEMMKHCIYKQNKSTKYINEISVSPKRTLRSKSVNMLNSDPLSKPSKIAHAKKIKKKTVGKKKYLKVGSKMTCNSKETPHSMLYYDTHMDSQQNCGDMINESKPNISSMFDKDLFIDQSEVPILNCQTEKKNIVNDFKSNQIGCVQSSRSLNENNVDEGFMEKETSDTDRCLKPSCSPKSNMTFDLSNDESSLCIKNVINTTYDKTTSVETESTEGHSLNKTFDKTDHEIISSDLDIKENVLQLENQCEASNTHMIHFPKKKLDDIDQVEVDSELKLGATLIRQETFTKESKACPRQLETVPCTPSSNVTIHSALNNRSVGRDLAPADHFMTASATSVGVLSKEFGYGRKRSRTEGTALNTPLLHTPRTPFRATTPASSGEGGAKLPMRTQLPDFAALHRRQFARMESLDECQRRRALRAQRLLQTRPARTPGDPQRKKVPAASPACPYNRFGYKAQAATEAAVGGGGTRVVHEARARSRSLLQGVRTNRRFELLMKARKGAP